MDNEELTKMLEVWNALSDEERERIFYLIRKLLGL
jgi:hypothetical protein